jgi:hypothetical protein
LSDRDNEHSGQIILPVERLSAELSSVDDPGPNRPDFVVAEPPLKPQLWFSVPPDRIEDLYATVATFDPFTKIIGDPRVASGFDNDATVTLIHAGLTFAVAIGLVAFVIAAVDRSVAGRRRNARRLALGVPRRLVIASEAVATTVTGVVGVCLTAVLVLLVGAVELNVAGTDLTGRWDELAAWLAFAVGGVLLSVPMVAALVSRSTPRRPEVP